MEQDAKIPLKDLRVDGGASANDFLMEFQADILGESVIRPEIVETTALGAAYLAGLGIGYYKSREEIEQGVKKGTTFTPKMEQQEREMLLNGWEMAINQTRGWH